jgi:hypothetical protein
MKGMALASPFAAERIDLCFLDVDFSVAHVFSTGDGWNATSPEAGWDQLGGQFITTPAMVATKAVRPLVNKPTEAQAMAAAGMHGGGLGGVSVLDPQPRLDVFAVAPDFGMRQQTLWQGVAPPTQEWTNLGGSFISAPTAAAAFGDKRIDLFGLGRDRAMYHKAWDGEVWTGDWERLGGIFSSDASAVSWAPGQLDLFVRGSDYTLRHRAYDGSQWLNDWQNLGGSLASAPAAVTWGPNRLDVFAVSKEGSLGHRWWDGMIWNDWEDLGVPAINHFYVGTPSVVSIGSHRINVLILGDDANLYHVWLENGSWKGPTPLDAAQNPGVGSIGDCAVISTTPGSFHAFHSFEASHGGPIVENTFDGSGWTSWEQTGMHAHLPTQYTFSVDLVNVLEARSFNTDTDHAQITLKVGNWKSATIGEGIPDIGGTHGSQWPPALLSIGPVIVELCDSVAFNYTIVNKGDPTDLVQKAMTFAGQRLAGLAIDSVSKGLSAGFDAITDVEITAVLTVPVLGPLLALAESWLLDQLKSIIFAGCDGIVAVEQPVFLGRDLYQRLAGGTVTTTTQHPGTDSNWGCGENSLYEVTWTIAQ